MNVYLQHILPGIAAEGTDSTTFGSATTADIAILQALSKRIHHGKFIAEAKFQAEERKYATLIENNDAAGILETLTNRAVEKKVLERVKLKASTYGQDISVSRPDSGEESFAFKVDPQLISDLYRDFVMPLTKEVEVEYLLTRLDRPVVAVAGEAGSFAWMAAERHFGTLAMNTFISKEGIKDVVAMVENNSIAYGVLPFEDSQIGIIKDTQTCLLRGTVKIAAEIFVPKHLVIAGSVSLQMLPSDAVTKVYVPLEVIDQVQNQAEKFWPSSAIQPVKSAKDAVANLRDSESTPGNLAIAIITKQAAQIHEVEHTKLPINFADVEEGPSAYMRMLVIAKFFPAATGNDKSFISIKLNHHVGSLLNALTIWNEHGISLSYLESIYNTDGSGYDFFVEFPGHIHDTNVQAAVQALSSQICSVHHLGSCPVKSTQECSP
uniref:Bifunctional chorismate mutase/prephenate dehydratase n=1 Tax=Albugo laibachii Nc14 TaxID=890382 RepID=F0WAP3_9STRA|nr:chorismate mutase putative [Albugo laibachii Nc14]|eukprot:CCA18214.1 chorismate mutase putative [Albugo laibachii Nc14]